MGSHYDVSDVSLRPASTPVPDLDVRVLQDSEVSQVENRGLNILFNEDLYRIWSNSLIITSFGPTVDLKDSLSDVS